jgi:hypothetical protein
MKGCIACTGEAFLIELGSAHISSFSLFRFYRLEVNGRLFVQPVKYAAWPSRRRVCPGQVNPAQGKRAGHA